jgi:uncharacterized protein YndB with AHSA1/START domain
MFYPPRVYDIIMVITDQIFWPKQYDPSNVPVHVRDELEIKAPPKVVWNWLTRASLWPTWYPNSANVRFLKSSLPSLALGTRFKWKTFSLNITSTVLEFVPFERLSWDGKAFGLNIYHAWLIQKTEDGCRVVTEESQNGILARFQNLFLPNRMKHLHQIWLERLKEKAERGNPPDS